MAQSNQNFFGLCVAPSGPATWAALFREYLDLVPGGGTPAPPQPTTPPFPGTNFGMGSRGESVRLVQEAFSTLAACYPGRLWTINADGIFGPMTRDAIFTFQNVFGLPITGVVDRVTWDRLMQEAANCSAGAMYMQTGAQTTGTAGSTGTTGSDNFPFFALLVGLMMTNRPGTRWK